MNDGTVNMTIGDPKKLIFRFAVPVFLSQLFQQLYNTADSLIVGRFLGTEALAAVSSSGPLIFMLISFVVGAAMGSSVVISRYFGAGDYEKVSRAIHTSMVISLICGVFLTAVGVIFTPTFLTWMGTDPEVMPQATDYFRYFFMGYIPIMLYNSGKGIMNALGDSKRPLYYLIFSSVLNVLLDLLFIAVFKWGVWSAAVATVISQAVSTIPCLIHLSRPGTIYQLDIKKLKIDREMFKEILRYGLPAGIQNSVVGLANVVVQTNINMFGKAAMAGFGTYSKIEGFAFLPMMSFNMALTTYTGQNLGAKEYLRTKQGARFGILSAVVLAELTGLCIYLLAPQLISLFSDDAAVIAYGAQQCRVEALFYCLLAFSHAVAAICRGAGKAFVPMTIMLSVWCVIRIAYLTIIMGIMHEVQYVYWAYPITWGISSIIYLIYFLFSDWIHGFDKADKKKGVKA